MKKKRLVILLVLMLLIPKSLLAATNSNYNLGQLENVQLKLVYRDVSINTYKAYGTNYIAVADLRQLGSSVAYLDDLTTLSISAPLKYQTTTSSAISITPGSFTFYNGTVQFGNLQTQCLSSNGRTFIPLATLSQFGTLSITDNICTFIPGSEPPVLATESSLTNLYHAPVEITLLDIYWNSEATILTSTYTLAPNESITRTPQIKDENSLHMATLVQHLESEGINYTNNSYLGQLNTPLMQKYSRFEQGVFLDDYGDPIDIESIIWAEDTINSKNLSSPTPYLVWTNISQQRTYIFQGSTNNWTLIKHFICSTGRDRTPTPTGKYALTYKVPSFGQNKGYMCKYAFGFIGTTYLYHSIIYDKTGTYLLENKGVLGKKASDGCIRFSVDYAKWFYDNMIPGTTVYIS